MPYFFFFAIRGKKKKREKKIVALQTYCRAAPCLLCAVVGQLWKRPKEEEEEATLSIWVFFLAAAAVVCLGQYIAFSSSGIWAHTNKVHTLKSFFSLILSVFFFALPCSHALLFSRWQIQNDGAKSVVGPTLEPFCHYVLPFSFYLHSFCV